MFLTEALAQPHAEEEALTCNILQSADGEHMGKFNLQQGVNIGYLPGTPNRSLCAHEGGLHRVGVMPYGLCHRGWPGKQGPLSVLVAQASEVTEGTAGPECPERLESPEQYCLATQSTHMEQGPYENWTCDDLAFLGRTGGGMGGG